MFAPIARIYDMHLCPMVTPAVVPIPHVGGPVIGPGAPTVMVNGIPVAVVGDMAICPPAPPDVLMMGALTVLAEGKPVVRVGDTTMHGGSVIIGCPTVLVGDAGTATPQAATMRAAKLGAKPFTEVDCQPTGRDGTAQKVAPPVETGDAWLEVEVVDADGKPVPYRVVEVTDAGGTVRRLHTNAKGLVRLSGIAPGQCTINLPDLDQSSWKPA